MAIPPTPRMRPLELMPAGRAEEGTFLLRDPEGFAQPAVVPLGAAMLITLMDGRRSLSDIQREFTRQAGHTISLADVEQLVRQLDEAHFLESLRFESHRTTVVDEFVRSPSRPAAHAGSAYESDPAALRQQFADLFTTAGGPHAPGTNGTSSPAARGPLEGVLSPHIDFRRGGPAFAWAYQHVLEHSKADLFIVFGTAHSPMKQLFSALRKDFETPLGTVSTDLEFIDRLAQAMDALAGEDAAQVLFDDDIAHRHEHSIEFQAVFLKYVLERQREFSIVPILVGSFSPFMTDGRQPKESRLVATLIEAIRSVVRDDGRRVCFISGGDLAHIGQQFGDPELLDEERLAAQRDDDNRLLARACQHDTESFFDHVAQQQDRNRICGLSPTYMMLAAMGSSRGDVLRYDQAVSSDRTNCVTFASVAFYGQDAQEM